MNRSDVIALRRGKRSKRADTKPITLYFWPTPNGKKISIMLEECKLPYEVHFVNIGKGEQFSPSFLRLSPNNKIPAITDRDGPGGRPISIFESGAILRYLGDRCGRYYPKRIRERVEIDQWLCWQIGGLGPMAGQVGHFRHFAPENLPYAIDRFTKELVRLYGVMDKRLERRKFLAGRYSIADIACVGWIMAHSSHGIDLAEFPHVERWLTTMMERPGVQRGLAVRPPAD